MSRALLADIFRAVKKSKARFISIIIIVALGAGFFVGVKSAGPSMNTTAKDYFSSNNLMDIRVQSPIGLTSDDLAAIKNTQGVSGAMGCKFADALVLVNGQPEIDIDGAQISVRAYGIDLNKLQRYYYGADDPDFINRPILLEGTYPTAANQCLVDASRLSTPESYQIGNYIKLEEDANSDLSNLTVKEFQIVGIIESPYYLSFERGNSLVGNGKIGTYIFIPESAFSNDYYSEIYLTVENADNFEPYSDEYFNHLSPVIEKITEVGSENVTVRAAELSETLPEQIKTAEKNYNSAKKTLDEGLKEAEEQIALYQKYVNDPEGSYNEAVNKAAEALGIAESEFNGNYSLYQQAVEKYNAMLEAYNTAKKTQAEKAKQLSSAVNEYNTAQNALNTAQATVNTAAQLVSTTNNVIEATNSVLTSLQEWQDGKIDDSQLSQVLQTLQNINPSLYQSIVSLSAVSMAMEAVALINPYLEQQKNQLAVYENDLNNANKQLTEYKNKFATAAQYLNLMQRENDAAEEQLESAYDSLNDFYTQLEGSNSTLTQAQIELMLNKNSVDNDLNLLKATIANAETYLEKAKSEYNRIKADSETQLANAEKKIDSAKNLLKKASSAKWNIYDRNDTPGYSSYESAVNNVNVLSNIFPVIFFLVAALVCLTTMSRMVEEERTRMGTLKALGYSSAAIASKYIIYALFASVIGSLIGIIIGLYAIPFAIFKAYSIMFTMPSLEFTFPVKYIIAGMGISLLTTLLASGIASARELRVHPASLMRPKAPKPGKRVLLEKIHFIWKRMSFTSKVTTRNLFRKKTRFVMTVLGVGGCTALILASTGLYSSISGIMSMQYGDNGISRYDVQIAFAENQTEDSATMQILKSDGRISDIMLSSMLSVTGGSENSDKTEDVYLFVPKDNAKFAEFIKLNNRKSGEALSLDDTGAMITEKFAQDTNTGIGDSVWVDMADGERISIPVASITENYAFSYIYLSENLYQYLFQTPVSYNFAIGTVDPSVLSDTAAAGANAETKQAQLSSELMAYDSINAVAFISDTVDTLNEVIGVLSIIIIIFVVAAGLLAFIVLYNLSNINISERQRELATIRVLGFHNKEVSAYIYRENVVLTIMGIILGLVLGVFVHKLLLIYCSVDTVMFVQTLSWYSYVIAAVLTAIFAVLVNLIMHKKMLNINMVESLKAIE